MDVRHTFEFQRPIVSDVKWEVNDGSAFDAGPRPGDEKDRFDSGVKRRVTSERGG